MVVVESAQKSYNKSNNSAKVLSNRYGLKTHLKLLCFINNRETRSLETNGAIIIKTLGMTDKAYEYIAVLEADGMITRDKRKYITLTEQGEETIKKNFFTIIPNNETNYLLKNFVRYLSLQTIPFLKKRRSVGNYVPDRYLTLLNEELLEFFEDKMENFCRNIEAFRNEVN